MSLPCIREGLWSHRRKRLGVEQAHVNQIPFKRGVDETCSSSEEDRNLQVVVAIASVTLNSIVSLLRRSLRLSTYPVDTKDELLVCYGDGRGLRDSPQGSSGRAQGLPYGRGAHNSFCLAVVPSQHCSAAGAASSCASGPGSACSA